MRTALVIALLVATSAAHGDTIGPRFFADDPLRTEPATQDAAPAASREVSLTWDVLYHLFARRQVAKDVRAMDVNTADGVPDSEWYTNRDLRALDRAALTVGPNTHPGPVLPWSVVSGKTDGATPGFVVLDAAGVRWFMKLDPAQYPELASGAEVIATRLFWALGYFVPDNRIAYFTRADIGIARSATYKTADGRKRPLTPKALDRLLGTAARRADGRYRVLASRALDGKPIGPFLYAGTRTDDPNDVIPHEHRRSLRGLRVFAAWLNHVDAKSINTLDTVIERDGRKIVRHHLLDFGSTLGSAGLGPRAFDEGNAYVFDRGSVARSMFTLGLAVPPWRRTPFAAPASIGRFEGEHFDPTQWKPRIPNPAFIEAMPDDLFWAAHKMMSVDRRVIEAAVNAADYSDPAAGPYVVKALLERRRHIFEAYLNGVAPLVDFSLSPQDVLYFSNAAVDADVARRAEAYTSTWYEFDNVSGVSRVIGERRAVQPALVAPVPLPTSVGAYVRIDIGIVDSTFADRTLQVFFRRDSPGWTLVGVDRMTRRAEVTRP